MMRFIGWLFGFAGTKPNSTVEDIILEFVSIDTDGANGDTDGANGDNQLKHMFPHEFHKNNKKKLVCTSTYSNRYCNGSHKKDQVSHIIAKNNGGANAVSNYFMSPAKFNQSIQDNYDHLNAALVGKERARDAVKVSKENNNYSGLSGSTLHQKGIDAFEHVGIKVRKEGGIDSRCVAVRNGDLIIRKDGGLDGRSKYIKRKIWKEN